MAKTILRKKILKMEDQHYLISRSIIGLQHARQGAITSGRQIHGL